MAAPLILLEVSPRRVADGVAETLYLAGMGGTTPYFYNNVHWRGGLSGLPSFVNALDFSDGEFGTGGVPTAGQLVWTPQTLADLALLSAYVWEDAVAVVRIGVEGAFPAGVTGSITATQSEPGKLTLYFADVSQKLKAPILKDRYAGTGGLEGPAEWEDKIKRRIFGRVWNVAGEPIDPPNNIYAFSDPTRPLNAFTEVRDMGVATTSLTFLAWQGTAAATLAALRAAVAPAGGGVVCPSIACVKWWTEPGGDLCADIQGEVGAGYVETAAEIAATLAGIVGGPAFAAGTVAAAKAARPAAVGLFVSEDSTTGAAALDKLLGDSSLLWIINAASQIVIRQWAWGASVLSVASHSAKRIETHRPVATRKIGYRHNENVMSRGDLAAIILASDVVYNDGQTVEDLQPAQPGADVTGDNTSKDTNAVGGTPAEQLLADIAIAEAAAAQAQTDAAQAAAAAAAAQTAVATAQADIIAQGQEIEAAQADIIANATSIETLQTTVSSQGSSITTLQTAVTSNTGNIATLQTTVSSQGGAITANATSITNLQGTVSSLSTTVTSQGGAITTLQSTTSTQAGQISTLQTTVTTQGASITSLQTTTTTQAGQIATLTTRVGTSSINLLPNGGLENGFASGVASSTNFSLATSSSWGRIATTTTTGIQVFAFAPVAVTVNQSYTASCDPILFGGASTGYVDFIGYNSSGTQVWDSTQNTVTGAFDFSPSTDRRSQIANTQTIPAGVATVSVRFVCNVLSGNTCGFRQMKLQQGTTWTEYGNETAVVQSFTAISTLNTQYSSLSTTVSTQGSSITANSTAITTLQTQTATLTTQVSAGNPNLIANSTFQNGFTGWTTEGSYFWAIGNTGAWGTYAVTSTNSSQITAYLYQDIQSPENDWYTATADMGMFLSGTGAAGLSWVEIQWLDSTRTQVLGVGRSAYRNFGSNFDPTGASRQALKCTSQNTYSAPWLRVVYYWQRTGGNVSSYHIRQCQLVRGSALTAYSQEATVLQTFTAINTTNTQVASLSSTVSTQGVTITSQQTAITTLNGNMTTVLGKAGVTVDVNGYVTGWSLNNNGNTGNMTIRSDRFRVVPPSGSGDGFYVDIDGSNRTTQYILSGSVRVVEIGWLAP